MTSEAELPGQQTSANNCSLSSLSTSVQTSLSPQYSNGNAGNSGTGTNLDLGVAELSHYYHGMASSSDVVSRTQLLSKSMGISMFD